MEKYLKLGLLLLVLFFVFFITTNFSNNLKKKINNNDIKKIIEKKESVTDSLRKKYNNDDIIGTISISNTDINEILLQARDNKYYLTHDAYGNYDKYGSVFLDHRCNKDSKKLLIFGHNDFKEETPFSNLENYYDKSYYENNQYIDVIIDDEKMKYQIFSVYIETEDFTYMNLNIDENKYNADLIKYKNKSLYNTDVSVSPSDKILVLQTCSNHKDYKKYKDKYLLIIAKKII